MGLHAELEASWRLPDAALAVAAEMAKLEFATPPFCAACAVSMSMWRLARFTTFTQSLNNFFPVPCSTRGKMSGLTGVKCILLDIEGTVCPISFVKDTLFPYAIKALPGVLAAQWNEPTFTPYRDAFPEEVRGSPEALQAHVEDLTRRDVKVAPLKNLQGYLWEDGYKTGTYSTPLFGDVPAALQRWKDAGHALAIYSSGSVFAQKLLFEHVQDGKGIQDLTGLFIGWFDTVNAGLKTEATSYSKIAEALEYRPEEVLFLSDNVREVDAAHKVKMQSVVIDRPGNADISAADKSRLEIVTSLSDIQLS